MNCIHNEYNKPDLNPAVKFCLCQRKVGNVLAVPNSAGLALGSPTWFNTRIYFQGGVSSGGWCITLSRSDAPSSRWRKVDRVVSISLSQKT